MSEKILCSDCNTVVFILQEGTKKRTSGVVCYCKSCDDSNKRLAHAAAQALKGKKTQPFDVGDIFGGMKF